MSRTCQWHKGDSNKTGYAAFSTLTLATAGFLSTYSIPAKEINKIALQLETKRNIQL